MTTQLESTYFIMLKPKYLGFNNHRLISNDCTSGHLTVRGVTAGYTVYKTNKITSNNPAKINS